MKKFLYSFLGTMAGIWASVIIGTVLLLFTVGVMAVSSGSQRPASIKDDSVLHLELAGNVSDRQEPSSLIDQLYNDGTRTLNLNDITAAIAAAKTDRHIKGIFLDCKGAAMGMAQAQAIVKALEDFKESDKWVYSYADTYSQTDYFVASAADSLFINPIGMIDIHGLSATTLYFKDLLEKIGVEAQVVKVGTYKSAVEPFLLSQMSEANREQQTVYLSNIWNYMKTAMAKRRNLAPDSIDAMANRFIFAKNTQQYRNLKLVDALKYRHQVSDLLAKVTGKAEEPSLIGLTDYLSATTSPFSQGSSDAKNIAVLYALGDITESDDQGIASDRLVPEILKLASDKSIDGLVLRVNSGGGSAFASEQIWEALEQFKKISKKPFYVSMGDVAASGGYYISCGANRIYAEPLTLTGSIGIFGIIPNFQPLLRDKLGVNTFTVSTNQGSMPDALQPMTPEQRQAMQSYVDNGYELFVKRCAEGRKKTVDQIKAIAEGRVWDGQSALSNGLVDRLGGLDQAVADMAKELGSDNYTIAEYPAVKTKWWDVLLDMDSDLGVEALGTDARTAASLARFIRSICPAHPTLSRDGTEYLQCRADYIRLH